MAYGVSTSSPSAGGRSSNLTAGSIAFTMSADDFKKPTSCSVSIAAAAPSGTRSRSTEPGWPPAAACCPRLG